MVAVACLALSLVLCACMADVGFYLACRQKAQDAADAAALCAVRESFPLFSTGAKPDSAASEIAALNGARLEELDVSGGRERVQVQVSVETGSIMLGKLGILPSRVEAESAAEVDMEALLASELVWYTADPTRMEWLKQAFADGAREGSQQGSTMVVLMALQHIGKPYVWGATGPDSFDCSGLVCYVYAQIGVRLPRVTYSQALSGRPVSIPELAPGDLVFFNSHSHVGIYIGGGFFVHSPHSGDFVKVSPLGNRSISACRRIL